MSKTLVIPDLHNDVDWVEPFLELNKGNFDKVIFLGDYFDSYGDDYKYAAKTAYFVRRMIEAGHTLLFGNHDLPYAFPYNESLWCPGWESMKCVAVRAILNQNHFDQMKFCVEEQGFLLSHAGIHPIMFTHPVKGLSIDVIQECCAEAMQSCKGGEYSPYLDWGKGAGGSTLYGGIIWLRWYEFEPIPGINQIVGHTIQSEPSEKSIEGSENHCIDTSAYYCGVIQDGQFSTIKVK